MLINIIVLFLKSSLVMSLMYHSSTIFQPHNELQCMYCFVSVLVKHTRLWFIMKSFSQSQVGPTWRCQLLDCAGGRCQCWGWEWPDSSTLCCRVSLACSMHISQTQFAWCPCTIYPIGMINAQPSGFMRARL